MNYKRILLAVLFGLTLTTGCGKSESPTNDHERADDNEEHSDAVGEEHAEKDEVKLSLQAAQAAGIELGTAGPIPIRDNLVLYGTVQSNAERTREVTARYPGIIRTMARKVGDAVQQGQELATVESDESLRSYAVTSPLSGIVTARNANPGEKAGESPLFTVADLSTVWVELALFPRDLGRVQVGQPVRIKTVEGDVSAEGDVVYLAALGEAASQTRSARVLLDNRSRQWTPGLYVTGEVALSTTEVPVAVKTAALQTIESRSVVFVQTEDGFKVVPVQVGRSDGTNTEIRAGVSAGARYAATNSFVLKSELGKGEAGHDH